MRSLQRVAFGLCFAAGFWAGPFLVMFWEKFLPFLETRLMYPLYLYGSSRWLVPLGLWWGIQLFSLFETRLTAPTRWTGRTLAALLGAHWLLLMGYCSDSGLWVEGNGWELLLFRTEQQAQWYLSLLIGLNLIIGKFFGLFLTVDENGLFRLEWIPDAHILWEYSGVGIFLVTAWVVINRGLCRRWRCVGMPIADTLLKRWIFILGVVLMVSPTGLSIAGLSDVIPIAVSWLLLVGLSMVQFFVVLSYCQWRRSEM